MTRDVFFNKKKINKISIFTTAELKCSLNTKNITVYIIRLEHYEYS